MGRTIKAIAISPNSQYLAWTTEDEDVIRICEPGVPGRKCVFVTGSAAFIVVFSPDSLHLASGSDDGRLGVWTCERPGRWSPDSFVNLKGHRGRVTSLAFSPDSASLASGSDDKWIRIWACRNGDPGYYYTLGDLDTRHDGAITSLAYFPDGTKLASGSADLSVRLWAVGRVRGYLQKMMDDHKGTVVALAVSRDGSVLASAPEDTTVLLHDSGNGATLRSLAGHSRPVRAVVFLGEEHLASASDDCTVRLWNRAKGNEEESAVAWTLGDDSADGDDRNNAPVWAVAAAPTQLDSLQVAAWISQGGYDDHILTATIVPAPQRLSIQGGGQRGYNQRVVRMWDRPVRSIQREPYASQFVFSPDGRSIAWCRGASSDAATEALQLWDLESGLRIWQAGGLEIGLAAIDFSPDGRVLASGSEQGKIQLWDVATGVAEKKPMVDPDSDSAIYSLAISPDGRFLASTSRDSTFRQWGLNTGAKLWELAMEKNASSFEFAFSPDGRYVAVCSGKSCLLCDVEKGTQAYKIPGRAMASSPAFFPGKDAQLACVFGPEVLQWTDAAGITSVTKEFGAGGGSLLFSQDGKHLFRLTYQDYNYGSYVQWVPMMPGAANPLPFLGNVVGDLVISQDSQLVAVSSQVDYSVEIWFLEPGYARSYAFATRVAVISSSSGRRLMLSRG